MYHKITIAGRLGTDPELRFLADGTPVCNFSVAVNQKRKGEETTIWYRISAWNKTAEIVNEYLSKGRAVLIEGQLRADEKTGGPRIYQKNDGTAGTSFELNATNVTFLPGGNDGGQQQAASGQPAAEKEENEIPF